MANVGLACAVTQLKSMLPGHVFSLLWLSPGQGGRLSAWDSKGDTAPGCGDDRWHLAETEVGMGQGWWNQWHRGGC